MNDALDSAFDALDRAGIVAVQNAGGTQTLGWAAVNEEIAKRESKNKKVLGATFYHSQDLESRARERRRTLVYVRSA